MQAKMGFKECSEDSIKQKQQESEDLRANFEQTIKRLSEQKVNHEKQIEVLRQKEFDIQQKINLKRNELLQHQTLFLDTDK